MATNNRNAADLLGDANTDGATNVGDTNATDLIQKQHLDSALSSATVANATNATNADNADKVDGFHAAQASTVNTCAVRDGSGDINARLFRSEFDDTNASINFVMTQIDTATDNYIRPSTVSQLGTALENAGFGGGGSGSGSASTTGYVVIGDFILQWGSRGKVTHSDNASLTGDTMTFPVAFPTACVSVTIGTIDDLSPRDPAAVYVSAVNNLSFRIKPWGTWSAHNGQNDGIYYMALGY